MDFAGVVIVILEYENLASQLINKPAKFWEKNKFMGE
jgi:hypothetical protein